ncbi:MAG: AAA family ATPase [Aestuariivirga sp.]|uniref:AAA family ATPase n=1 Tax=Aestuariivirga sp. TaxID=2650926 RepID=UPI0025B9184C|nr:AAA family ATPase [Aestuariivirga sp.]MCA3559755.1 AAA family ATPase [Aestuariivirga sp.]
MKAFEARHYLLSAELLWERVADRSAYPYALPAIAGLSKIDFHPKVTFIVGENGSGKSTLIEALAVAWGFNPEGGSKNFNFGTFDSHSPLHASLRLIKSARRARDGFFLRAESYFNVATNIDALDKEPSPNPIKIIDSFGGRPLHEQSHGESFLALLENRLRGKGLYIFDEPEAALSPTRQMSMLVRMHDLIADDSQFIIATHSPILMAYPDAWIYQLGPQGLERVAYEDTEHYAITRNFLNRHKEVMRQLLDGD